MRILFVSDTHLGFDAPRRPRVERRRRGDDFVGNFEFALAPALAGRVDVVVHGGDLLYRSRVPPSLVEAALRPLKRVAAGGVPVLIVPGNHERSRLPYPMLALQEGLHVFDRPSAVVVEQPVGGRARIRPLGEPAADGLSVAFLGFPYAPAVRARFRSLLAECSQGAVPAQVSVLCMHQCVEGATCGPGHFVFRGGDDVIRAVDLPPTVAVVLSGHIHRHQVLRLPGRPPVVYAGSVERTSFAEMNEVKGAVQLELSAGGLEQIQFFPLPTRPMLQRRLDVEGLTNAEQTSARLRAVIGSTPEDAVLQLRVEGDWKGLVTAALVRAQAGMRTVSLVGEAYDPFRWRPPVARA